MGDESWLSLASEASACCVEEGPRAELGRGDFVLASEASLCCIEEGPRAELGHDGFGLASEASLCCIGQLTRTAPETHGPGDARSRSEVQNLMLR